MGAFDALATSKALPDALRDANGESQRRPARDQSWD
jgi:hypothetical protein